MNYEIWIAESDNGSVQFDTQPSTSDILNACEDLERPIVVYLLTLLEIDRTQMFTLD